MTTHRLTTASCSCRICKTDAQKLGLSLPLTAEVTEAFLAAAGAHAAVHEANHPVLGAAFLRNQRACVNA